MGFKMIHIVDIQKEINSMHETIYNEYLIFWLKENCKSWYYVNTNSFKLGTNLQVLNISVGFTNKSEAVHFKMVWE